MIRLSRLNGTPLCLNSDLIETVEATPDTLITMTTGKRYLVEDSVDTVVDRVIAFRRACFWDVRLLQETDEPDIPVGEKEST